MPTLELRLTNDGQIFKAENGAEEWILRPDASLLRTSKRFDVLVASKKYDGFDLSYNVTIKQRTPKNVAWAEKLAEMARHAAAGRLGVAAGDIPVGTIALSGWNYDCPPLGEIIVLLSDDALFRVQHNLASHVCRMVLTTDPFEAGLSYGDDPDGKDLRWHVDRVEVAIVKSMWLQFARQ